MTEPNAIDAAVFEECVHSRNDDHYEKVTSICYTEHYNVFVSSGHDSLLKIWGDANELLRYFNLLFW